MTIANLTTLLFRIWVKIHGRPLSLSQLKPLWREARRFAALSFSRGGLI
jgi:hypothetical protein